MNISKIDIRVYPSSASLASLSVQWVVGRGCFQTSSFDTFYQDYLVGKGPNRSLITSLCNFAA